MRGVFYIIILNIYSNRDLAYKLEKLYGKHHDTDITNIDVARSKQIKYY